MLTPSREAAAALCIKISARCILRFGGLVLVLLQSGLMPLTEVTAQHVQCYNSLGSFAEC